MKDVVAIIKDLFAAAKDAALVGCVAAVLIFPDATKAFLRTVGLTSFQTPLGTINLAENQVREGTAALTALSAAERTVPPESPAAQAIAEATRALQTATVRAQDTVAQLQPSALAAQGWMYLGTLDPQRTGWKPGIPNRTIPTVAEAFAEIRPGSVLRLRTDANLREAKPSAAGELARVVRVVREGQRVRVLEIDPSRPVDAGDSDAPGFRVWARVEVQSPPLAAAQ